jgi:hypothetical protein
MFGLGKGKIEIEIPKFGFSPGETITGKVIMDLKKNVKARGIKINLLREERRTRNYSGNNRRNSNFGNNTRTDYSTRIEFSYPLDGEKEYSPTHYEYPFEIKLPENMLAGAPSLEGAAGMAVKSAQILMGMSSGTKWYLYANLDVPWGFDVKKKVNINIA